MRQTRLHRDIQAAEQALKEAQDRVQAVTCATQADCSHDTVGLTPTVDSASGLFGPFGEFRVCLTCGLAERPSPDYVLLTPASALLPIGREDAYAHVRICDAVGAAEGT